MTKSINEQKQNGDKERSKEEVESKTKIGVIEKIEKIE